MTNFTPSSIKKTLSNILWVSLSFIPFNCGNPGDSKNHLLGKWESLWAGGQHKSIDFNISFETNYVFHVTAFGVGRTESQNISGIYWINRDTLTILDKLEEPKQLCSYTDTGRYTFIKRTDTLFFKVIKDECERRKLTLEIGLVKVR